MAEGIQAALWQQRGQQHNPTPHTLLKKQKDTAYTLPLGSRLRAWRITEGGRAAIHWALLWPNPTDWWHLAASFTVAALGVSTPCFRATDADVLAS